MYIHEELSLHPIFVPNLVDLISKNEHRNAKINRVIEWSSVCIFNETEPPWLNSSEILGQ